MSDKSKKITTLYKKKLQDYLAQMFIMLTIKNTYKFIHPGTVRSSTEVRTVVMYYTRKKKSTSKT